MILGNIAYHSPADVAQELTLQHVTLTGCMQCEDCDDDLCRFHQGYREGMTMLLIKASVNR